MVPEELVVLVVLLLPTVLRALMVLVAVVVEVSVSPVTEALVLRVVQEAAQ